MGGCLQQAQAVPEDAVSREAEAVCAGAGGFSATRPCGFDSVLRPRRGSDAAQCGALAILEAEHRRGQRLTPAQAAVRRRGAVIDAARKQHKRGKTRKEKISEVALPETDDRLSPDPDQDT